MMRDLMGQVVIGVISGVIVYAITTEYKKKAALTKAVANQYGIAPGSEQAAMLAQQDADFYL